MGFYIYIDDDVCKKQSILPNIFFWVYSFLIFIKEPEATIRPHNQQAQQAINLEKW